jgi:poly(3-hydroxybutyrate) depolymerase
VRFRRESPDPARAAALSRDPRVLVCAPLSGHHATLLRDTVATLLQAHDVYVTDWIDAREVPVAAGPFPLADYVAYLRAFVHQLGARELHVVAVCQPTVPALAAVALDAAAGAATPRTLTLMGGPVDPSQSPTAVNRFATEHPLAWFERTLIHRVPSGFAGAGRRVYPGFLQLSAFVQMNPLRHAQAYRAYWLDQLRGDTEAIAAHESFYDDYNAVLDMDAAYYLDTVGTVFQDMALARGTWEIDGARVQPAAITDTALFTIEGEHDDISGLGQTAAAHALCSGISHHQHVVADGCGHYGIFSGQRWRTQVYPRIHAFVRGHAGAGA